MYIVGNEREVLRNSNNKQIVFPEKFITNRVTSVLHIFVVFIALSAHFLTKYHITKTHFYLLSILKVSI